MDPIDVSWQMHFIEVWTNKLGNVCKCVKLQYLKSKRNNLSKLGSLVKSLAFNTRSFNLPLRILIQEVDLIYCIKTLMALRNKFGMCLANR